MHGLAEAFHLGNGGEEFLWGGIALGFVGGVEDVAFGGGVGIEGDAEVGGFFLLDDVEQCVGEAVEG